MTAPGTPQSPVEITDPRAMRALAHPARLAILQHLALEGPATATECAEAAGLSPSACSYHLRALAGHGFVEEDRSSAADGRHRPWKARVVSMTIGRGPGQPAAARTAGRLLTESLQARIEEVRTQYLNHETDYPARHMPERSPDTLSHRQSQARPRREGSAKQAFTGRELEVVRLLASGLTSREAAQHLHLSPHTVARHVTNMMHRSGARTRAALVARAFVAGVLDLEQLAAESLR